MNDDFSTLHLYLRERAKLFRLRFKRKALKEYFEDSFQDFLRERLISNGGKWFDSAPNPYYHLTDRYFRYCVYRREQFFSSQTWSGIISGVVSVITSIVTTMLTLRLGLR